MNTSITGPRLKTLRKSLGLSLEEVANRLDLDGVATLSSIEAGETLMTGDQLLLVAEKFNMDLERFLDPYFPIERDRLHLRRSEVSIESRKALERRAMDLITAFRFLSPGVGYRFTHRRTSLNLTRESQLEKLPKPLNGSRWISRWDQCQQLNYKKSWSVVLASWSFGWMDPRIFRVRPAGLRSRISCWSTDAIQRGEGTSIWLENCSYTYMGHHFHKRIILGW